MSRRAPELKLGQSPIIMSATRRWKSEAGIYSLLGYLTYRETVHNTQPFGKLEQTLSKKQQAYLQILTLESVIG